MNPTLRTLAAVLPLLLLPPTAPEVAASPVEARRLWKEARSLGQAPWPDRVRALRRVVAEAHPSDRYHRRALEALAALLRAEGLVHGATAWTYRSASLGPKRERKRLQALLRQGRALRGEGDLVAAREPLHRVAELARAEAPWLADGALANLAEDAADMTDETTVDEIAAKLRAEDAGSATRMVVLDRLGLLRLDRGDVRGARRALREAEAVYRASVRREGADAARCTRLWLDLALRERLRTPTGK